MAPLLIIAGYAFFGMAMFNLGLLVPFLRNRWYYRRLRRERAGRGAGRTITKDDIREELCRDPVAMDMFMDDRTPDDVQRYLYLEAERRAIMRKRQQLADNENDFFAPPRRPGPDPGFSGCRS
ncbi:MAG: hypothetical protein OXC06_10285 [Acidimicrobiaceae bacterium]|nr:hypothetical protein [Acidimicrobiaceae bacterium]